MKIDELVRDLSTVHPRPKSEVVRLVQEFVREAVERAKPGIQMNGEVAWRGKIKATATVKDMGFNEGVSEYHANLLRELFGDDYERKQEENTL